MRSRPKVVGLTGPIGSGKSTVAHIFEKDFGVPVYYADDRAKELMASDPELRRKIIEAFGPESYVNNSLNRNYLGEQVFADPETLKRLESIVHPAVRNDFRKWLQSFNSPETPYVVLENAILDKTGMDRFCDCIVFVTAPEDVRFERIKLRNPGWSESHIRQRMQNESKEIQNKDITKIILDNSRDVKFIRSKVKEIHYGWIRN